MVSDILRLMGQPFDKKILEELIEEVDADSKYIKLIVRITEFLFRLTSDFAMFITVSSRQNVFL